MKNGFVDPIGIRSQKPEDKPKNGKNSPWDFRCPEYDQRCSDFVRAGVNYGVGFAQSTGHKGNPTSKGAALPSGQRNTSLVVESQ